MESYNTLILDKNIKLAFIILKIYTKFGWGLETIYAINIK